jgi:hypothetical protein
MCCRALYQLLALRLPIHIYIEIDTDVLLAESTNLWLYKELAYIVVLPIDR